MTSLFPSLCYPSVTQRHTLNHPGLPAMRPHSGPLPSILPPKSLQKWPSQNINHLIQHLFKDYFKGLFKSLGTGETAQTKRTPLSIPGKKSPSCPKEVCITGGQQTRCGSILGGGDVDQGRHREEQVGRRQSGWSRGWRE